MIFKCSEGISALINPAINDGFADIFIVKYDSSGKVIWAKCSTGVGDVLGMGIKSGQNGYCYVAGTLAYTAIFGNDIINDSLAFYRFFILKCDSSGNFIWEKYATQGASFGNSVTTDIYGNCYIVGAFFDSTIIFGNDTLTNLTAAGNHPDIFVAKYDSSGNIAWAKTTSGGGTGSGIGISTDIDSNVYITGDCFGPAVFGNDTLSGAVNFFVSKLGYHLSTSIIGEPVPSPSILIFPNPSTSTFNFSGVTPGATIQVYNVLGEIIYSSVANSDNYRVNLNSQAKGIYFYRVSENGNNVGQGKIVLE